MVGMAIGVIMGKSPLKGSCGGVGAALKESDYVCDLCGGDQKKCDELSPSRQKGSKSITNDLGYDATAEQKKKPAL